jgi:hypothetical protein
LEAELRSALRAMATDVRISENHLGQLIEHLKRLLVACAKQSSADPGAISSMVARALGHAEFDRLWRDIGERELRELVEGEAPPEGSTRAPN